MVIVKYEAEGNEDDGGDGRGRNIGALIIRIGFWAHYTISIIRNPQNNVGNY